MWIELIAGFVAFALGVLVGWIIKENSVLKKQVKKE